MGETPEDIGDTHRGKDQDEKGGKESLADNR